MVRSEILIELEENCVEMEKLIRQQKFNIVDAQKFLMRYHNIYRKMEQLIESRDLWKKKYEDLKNGS